MAIDNTINTGISERSIGTNISGDAPDVQTGVTPQGAKFEVAQNAPSVLVKSSDDMSDSMEELSVAIAEKKEHEVKTVKQGSKATKFLVNVQQVLDFMAHMRQPQTAKEMERLAQHILKQGESAGQMRNMVQRQFRDPASQYMMMQFVAAYGKERGASSAKLDMANEALASLEEDHGDTIFAVVNAASEGYAYGATAAQVQQFVTGYKDAILDSKTLPDVLASVLSLLQPKEAGGADTPADEKSYQDVINHLIKALGNDMNALRPSREVEKLQVTLQDLKSLYILNSLLDNCRTLARGLEKYAENYAQAA